MDRRLEMIKAAESHYQSMMDKYALNANTQLTYATAEALDEFINCMEKYSNILAQFNLVQKIKSKILEQTQEQEQKQFEATENES